MLGAFTVPLILMHDQTNKVIKHKKSCDPLNLPMIPKFSNKGSLMTPKILVLQKHCSGARDFNMAERQQIESKLKKCFILAVYVI